MSIKSIDLIEPTLPMTLVISTLDFTAKFQREHGERGRQMR